MSNASDFIIENGVLKKYFGPGGEVVIPEGVQKIGEKAFRDCTNITSIKIPDSVTEIAHEAFSNCKGIQSIYLPNDICFSGRKSILAIEPICWFCKYADFDLKSDKLPERGTCCYPKEQKERKEGMS